MKGGLVEGVALLVFVLAAFGLRTVRDDESGFPTHFPGTSAKVCQLTGDFDKDRQEPTLSRTFERFGVAGTDLGDPVEHKGRLYFLFGDTPAIELRDGRPIMNPQDRRFMRDPIAYTTSTDPEKIELVFLVDEDGKWRPVTVPGIRQLEFEVSAGGLSVGGDMYIVFTTDHTKEKTMGRSVLAVSQDDGYNWQYLYDLSTEKFINVAMAEVKPSEVQELPEPVGTVLIWGSGNYRRSNPYLACVPSTKIEDKSALRYFAGLDESAKPVWKESEDDATPLFEHRQIGEFSVAWCDQLQYWLMLYNSGKPRGVVFRSSKKPWGPWSEIQVIFNGLRDGYGKFIHSPLVPGPTGINLSDPTREKVWGGGYAPYVLKRYFRGDSQRCTIYFTLSTWNPYQVVIMRADIGYPEKKPE